MLCADPYLGKFRPLVVQPRPGQDPTRLLTGQGLPEIQGNLGSLEPTLFRGIEPPVEHEC